MELAQALHPSIPETEAGRSECQASILYRRSRTARATQRKPVLKTNKQTNKNGWRRMKFEAPEVRGPCFFVRASA